MNTKQSVITDDQINLLLSELEKMPDSLVGDHLDEDTFAMYSLERLPPEEEERVDEHLLSCPSCCTTMEELIEWQAAAVHPEPVIQEPGGKASSLYDLYDLFASALGSLVRGLALPVPHQATALAANLLIKELHSPDGAVTLRRTEDQFGNWVIMISSTDNMLEGVEVSLSFGDWRRTLRLQKEPEGAGVWAELNVSASERPDWKSMEVRCEGAP